MMAPPLAMTQHPASIAAQSSSKALLLQTTLAPIPSGHLPTVNSCPCLGIALRSPCSRSYRCISVDLSHSRECHSMNCFYVLSHSDCHKSAASLSDTLKCFPFCPNWLCMQVSLLLQLTHLLGRDQVPLLFSLPPASFLHPAKFCMKLYFLSVVRDSCQYSAGSLSDPLHLKDIFLTSLWREMYSVSTYSAILSPSKEKIWKQFSSGSFFPSKRKNLLDVSIFLILGRTQRWCSKNVKMSNPLGYKIALALKRVPISSPEVWVNQKEQDVQCEKCYNLFLDNPL